MFPCRGGQTQEANFAFKDWLPALPGQVVDQDSVCLPPEAEAGSSDDEGTVRTQSQQD